jgi:hypothetical protein
MIKYALYSDVPNMYIRILESDMLVTKANSVEIHAQPDEQEPPTLKALPMCSDMPRLTHHSNAIDARLKRIVDMEIQAPSDNVKLTMIAQTKNQVWGSGATPTTYGQFIKQVNSLGIQCQAKLGPQIQLALTPGVKHPYPLGKVQVLLVYTDKDSPQNPTSVQTELWHILCSSSG